MSNESNLLANNIPGPAGGEVGYDPKEGDEMIAYGPHAVPAYWLSLFDAMHLVTFKEEGEDDMVLTIPSLVAPMGDARRLLRERREILAKAFPEFQPTWEQFARVIDGVKEHYIKVDVLELWDLATFVDEDFEAELRAGLRWFESQDEDDFNRLLSLASITSYDRSRRSFGAVDKEVPRAFHLRGYPYSHKFWDGKSDL